MTNPNDSDLIALELDMPNSISQKDRNWVVLCCNLCGHSFRVCGYRVIPEPHQEGLDSPMYIDWVPASYPQNPTEPTSRAKLFPLIERDAQRARAYHETAAFFAYRQNPECGCQLIKRLAHA